MESFFFRKWTCLTMALLAMVLIEDSMAWKCLIGEYHPPPPSGLPTDSDCPDSQKGACLSTTRPDGKRIKECESAVRAEQLVGGQDTCTTEPWNQFVEKVIRLDYRDGGGKIGHDVAAGQSEEDYVKEWVDTYTNIYFGGSAELKKDLTVCACSTESCNTDANDDALKQSSAGKTIPTLPPPSNGNNQGASNNNNNGSSSGGGGSSGGAATKTTLLADAGNLGAVMSLAVAVLAALVPGSGFRRSQ